MLLILNLSFEFVGVFQIYSQGLDLAKPSPH
jgi:hypothetical protein